ncbi:hypothetical protein LTR27_006462 [Elasticomyces elasticus]|nr:hypothetical protein LTR27_006462 [Elasticomyces elasticus]
MAKTHAAEERGMLSRSLQADRLIDIYVGKVTPEVKPFRVQQVLLGQLSDYFTKALRANTFREGEQGRVHFPDDDSQIWEVLLNWIINRSVPSYAERKGAGAQAMFIHCWILGDKY